LKNVLLTKYPKRIEPEPEENTVTEARELFDLEFFLSLKNA